MQCPNCGAEASGKFCSACGASLQSGSCARCGAALLPGARFCNQCGATVGRAGGGAGSPAGGATGARGGAARGARGGSRAGTTSTGSNLPWYLLAGVLLLIIAWLAYPMISRRDAAPIGSVESMGGGAAGGTGAPGPLTGTPREQADRLFNRIMTAQESGDTTNAKFFAPMGIQAYGMAEPLDHDGLYHLGIIHNVAGDFAAARATAERILADNPNHLLGLAVAAEAAENAGDTAAMRGYYARFIAAYDVESTRDIAEYRDHSRILPEHLAAARRATR